MKTTKIFAKHRRFPRTCKILVDIYAPPLIGDKIFKSVIAVIKAEKDGHYNAYDVEVKTK